MFSYLSAIAAAECRSRLHNPNSVIHLKSLQQNIHNTAILDKIPPLCSLQESTNLPSTSTSSRRFNFIKHSYSNCKKYFTVLQGQLALLLQNCQK